MPFATVTTFIALCISAPWISSRWGWRGNLAWGIAALIFIIYVLLGLD